MAQAKHWLLNAQLKYLNSILVLDGRAKLDLILI